MFESSGHSIKMCQFEKKGHPLFADTRIKVKLNNKGALILKTGFYQKENTGSLKAHY